MHLTRSGTGRLISPFGFNTPIKFASCMAENTERLCRDIAEYVQASAGIPMHYVTGIPWQKRERLFDTGEIHILWLCGLPYVQKIRPTKSRIELLAVPVPVGSRYAGKPVYYSDIVVNRKSRFESFDDLRGSSWAYNEPLSHSGFNVVRAFLAACGHSRAFFGHVIESGAHTVSLEMILDNQVDGAAIDSTVLEWIVSQRPDVRSRIRVVTSLGPSPIPPWVVSTQVPVHLRRALRDIFLGMNDSSSGRAVLGRAGINRFVAAKDHDYDPIRRMAMAAASVSLS